MKGEDFPDQPQIELIRERIWSAREFGRASVMVGAGFSKNARGTSPMLSSFPSWGELASVMYEALYPPNRSDAASWREAKKVATSGTGAMNLSSEYEALFGRAALDDLVSRSIPDERFEPGPLHSRLLSLPWSDVFTTNYDTLLERARTHPEVYERKYELVLTPADLPLRAKPRIVKLHGTLPSHRPFIITEEDYRTYPERFAPFVNTVQQSIMENALCLLGFSGEDPNFLRWIGWVRDNLGASVPPIYLCGLLGLSRSQRELLGRRNVVPIDLSPLFPTSEWHDAGQRHAKAIEWFLRNLDEGQPPQVDGWPEPGRKKMRRWSADLPGVPSGLEPALEAGPARPSPRPDLQEIRELHGTWRSSRSSYPGWVILPERNRKSLWRNTEYWIEPVLEFAPQLDAPDDLLLLRELNWRLERCLVPLFEPWTDKIIEVLGAYNPYPKSLELEGATFTPENPEGSGLEWGTITEAWAELAFAIARVSREDQQEERYRLWMERLESLARRRPDWKARFSYERCLFSLGRLDQDGVQSALDDWPSAEGLSFWNMRRAAVLAEMGELQRARQVANDVLSEIRRRSEPFSSDRALLSQEGLAILFLELAEMADLSIKEEELFRNRGRLDRLQSYRCDPRAELNGFEGTVVGLPPPLRTFSDTTLPSFDPDRETTTVNFPSGFSAEPILPAFALLRMVEDGAVPPRVANVNSFSETAMVATRWTESYTPLWSVCSEVRYGPASKKLYERFDRVRVATMPQEVVDHLSRVLIGALARSVEQLQYNSAEADPGNPSFAHRQVLVTSELLSRLYFRLSASQQDEVFGLAIGMYRMPLFQARHWLHSGIASLFERMLAAETSGDGLLARVPALLDLPVPGEPGVQVRLEDTWVEPLQHTVWDRNESFESGLDPTVASPAIGRLIRLTRDGAPGSRRRAVARLGALHNMGVLTEEEERGFGEALWTRVSSDTGLPEDTDLYDYAYLNLQEPEPGRASRAFRELMQSRDFTRMVADGDGGSRITAFSTGHGDDPYTRNILGATAPRMRDDNDPGGYVDWAPEEIESMLHKVARRWDSEKEELRSRIAAGGSEGHFARIVTQHIEGWLAILSRVVLPSIGDADERVRETARRLVLEMDEPGALASSALPALLHVVPGDFEEVANKLRDRINDNDAYRVRAVALGISLWLQHAAADGIPSPPEDLLDSLIGRILSRKQVAMDTILGSLRVMLEKTPGAFDEAKLEGLSLALGHLLEDTQLPAYEDREREDRLGSVIPVELRSRHRQLAAQLAYRLHLEFTRRSLEIPDVLERWRQACSRDPLPEVRRAWLVQE